MRIAVLGAGAMGSLFGGKLKESGEEVALIDVWKELVDSINRKGLRIEGIGGERVIKIKAVSSLEEIKEYVDLILVFVKSNQTEMAVKSALSIVGDKTLVMTLQNGLGNGEAIANIVGEEKTIIGTTANGATLIAPGRVLHAGFGETIIGQINGDITKQLENIVEVFDRAGLPTKVSKNINGSIWEKLLVNVGINPLTAILKVPNGYLVEHKSTEELLEMLVKEGLNVATAKKITFESDPIAKCKKIAKDTAKNFSSMYQDILNKRKTEIDYINGAIVKEGARLGVETPLNSAVVKLIKALEEGF